MHNMHAYIYIERQRERERRRREGEREKQREKEREEEGQGERYLAERGKEEANRLWNQLEGSEHGVDPGGYGYEHGWHCCER